jgi:hypothetical protein
VLGLFAMIVDKGCGFAEALTVASYGMLVSNYYVKAEALWLLQMLVCKEYGIPEAIKALKVLSDDGNWVNVDTLGFRYSALKLFEELFKRNKGFDEAQKIIDENKTTNSEDIKKDIIKLSNLLNKYKNKPKEEILIEKN